MNKNKNNVIFFGTPDFVVPVVESLAVDPYSLAAVITNPDRPVGRKQIITPSPVKVWGVNHNVPVLTPETLDDNFIKELRIMNYELGVLASYGKIIPQTLIDLFPKGIIVIHPSLLPKYRGATPVPAAITCGETETGSTFLLMDEKMDHGPILYQFKSKITETETAGELTKRLFLESANILPEVITKYLGGEITPQPQDHTQATFTRLFDKEHGFIPWEIINDAILGNVINHELPVPFIKDFSLIPNSFNLNNLIRALSPWPGVWTQISINNQPSTINNKRLKILKAHLENNKLVLDEVQLEGKKPISWQQLNPRF